MHNYFRLTTLIAEGDSVSFRMQLGHDPQARSQDFVKGGYVDVWCV